MEASTNAQALYCFGRFTVDPVKRLLSRDGTLVPLRPTVFETLLYLLDNPGRVVTKAELFEAVWPDRIVEESNISQTMFLLRTALDDKRLIVTAPGRGYQFTAAVRREDVAVETPRRPARANAKRAFRPRRWIGWALVATTAIYVLYRIVQPWDVTIAPLRDARGLVVLADFQNLTNQPALGKTLMTASEADLRAIPGLSILDEEHVQAALTSLGEATDAVLSPGLARRVCVHGQGRHVLRGSVSQVGSRYLLAMTATRCADDKVVGNEATTVDSADDLLPALERVVDRLRYDLGASDGRRGG